MTKLEICALFNCTIDQLNAQYKTNADGLNTMRIKAAKTGKRVNGYTKDQLTKYAAQYKKLSQS